MRALGWRSQPAPFGQAGFFALWNGKLRVVQPGKASQVGKKPLAADSYHKIIRDDFFSQFESH